MLTLSKIKRAFRRLVGIGQLFFYGLVSDTLSFQLFDVSKVSLCTLWKFRGSHFTGFAGCASQALRESGGATPRLRLSKGRTRRVASTSAFPEVWRIIPQRGSLAGSCCCTRKKGGHARGWSFFERGVEAGDEIEYAKRMPLPWLYGCAIYRISLEGWRGTTRTSYFCYAMYGGKRHLVTWIDFLEANHEVSIFCKDSIRWCLPDDPSNRKKKQPHKSLIGFGFSILWRMPGWLDCSPQRHPVQH